MALIYSAKKVLPGFSTYELLNEIGIAALYQAETVYGNTEGYNRVEFGEKKTDSGFISRWEKTTGKKWGY